MPIRAPFALRFLFRHPAFPRTRQRSRHKHASPLKNTAGISVLAAEGAEKGIRLRRLSLQATGDLFIDGMRDPTSYDRDTFNLGRLEVLRGFASILIGRGSTGGAVSQVSKVPQLIA